MLCHAILRLKCGMLHVSVLPLKVAPLALLRRADPHAYCCAGQVVLLGLCLTPDQGGDPMGELLVQPLPAYSCSSDSVPMICMATTPDGRIFAGGQNGGVYEIVYSSRDTWRQKRMFKV